MSQSSTARGILHEALQMPWKARNELLRCLSYPRAVWALRGLELGSGWRCYGTPIVQGHRASQIRIGPRMTLRSSVSSNPLAPYHPVVISTRRAGACIHIGADFGMTGGSLVCDERIEIGERVWVGANCVITDTDFHPLSAELRREQPLAGKSAAVTIGDDVFIGMQVIVLKGVRIGSRAVIGAGSVLRSDVPAGAIAAGNPAIIIGHVPS